MANASRAIWAAAFAAGLWASAAAAHDYQAGDLVIEHPWTRATPPGAAVAAGYAVIRNEGETPDALIGGSFEASDRVEIHEMAVVDDVMRMRELAGGIAIAPGESVELRPGGLHMMFMGLSDQLKEGETVSGALEFERAGRVEVVFKVEALRAGGGHAHGHGDQAAKPKGDHHGHDHSHDHKHGHGDHHSHSHGQ